MSIWFSAFLFGHITCITTPNEECETIFNIYSSISFQSYIESLIWTAYFIYTLFERFGTMQNSNAQSLKIHSFTFVTMWIPWHSPNSHQPFSLLSLVRYSKAKVVIGYSNFNIMHELKNHPLTLIFNIKTQLVWI